MSTIKSVDLNMLNMNIYNRMIYIQFIIYELTCPFLNKRSKVRKWNIHVHSNISMHCKTWAIYIILHFTPSEIVVPI